MTQNYTRLTWDDVSMTWDDGGMTWNYARLTEDNVGMTQNYTRLTQLIVGINWNHTKLMSKWLSMLLDWLRKLPHWLRTILDWPGINLYFSANNLQVFPPINQFQVAKNHPILVSLFLSQRQCWHWVRKHPQLALIVISVKLTRQCYACLHSWMKWYCSCNTLYLNNYSIWF